MRKQGVQGSPSSESLGMRLSRPTLRSSVVKGLASETKQRILLFLWTQMNRISEDELFVVY